MLTLLFFSFIFAANPWESGAGLRKPAGCDFFTKTNAVKILDADVTWTGTDSTANEPKKWTCTFVQKKAVDGPKVHFGLLKFSSDQGVRDDFDTIVRSNKDLAGFEKWQGLGDEAIVHTDGANFHLVVVRKGLRSFRIKVNPAGSTSLSDVKLVAEDLVRKMEKMEGASE